VTLYRVITKKMPDSSTIFLYKPAILRILYYYTMYIEFSTYDRDLQKR